MTELETYTVVVYKIAAISKVDIPAVGGADAREKALVLAYKLDFKLPGPGDDLLIITIKKEGK